MANVMKVSSACPKSMFRVETVNFHQWKKRTCKNRLRHTHAHAQMSSVCCVAEGSSHVLLWLYKGSVFRGLQCGDAWHGGVKLPVKPTETGKGHRQQHTWRVSLRFLTASLLSVCLRVEGLGRWGGGHTSVFLETTWNETSCSLTYMVEHSWRTISKCEHLITPHPTPYTHTHNFLQPLTHAPTLSTTYGISFNPLFPLSATRSFHQPLMDASLNRGCIISNS